jgi:hypothetical protein
VPDEDGVLADNTAIVAMEIMNEECGMQMMGAKDVREVCMVMDSDRAEEARECETHPRSWWLGAN